MAYDSDNLFVFAPELDIGLRAGAFEGYGNVRGLDLVRKRAALNTWMSCVRHEPSGDLLRKETNGSSYLDWLAFDLEEIGIRESKARLYWDELRLVVGNNADPAVTYNDSSVKDRLEKFNQYWNSEHRQLENALLNKPYLEGTQTWRVVHANQQPGLVALFKRGILESNLTVQHGHAYQNEQGRGGLLPTRRGGYWSYDYDTGGSTRGAARVVVGPVRSATDGTREVWFTDSHYTNFVRVVKGHHLVRDAH